MNTPPDMRLAELFVRYWDNALTVAEAEELNHRLVTDPVARDCFQTFILQAVAAADLRATQPAASETEATPLAAPAKRKRRLSRRGVLGLLGGGMAAGIAGLTLSRWLWPEPNRPVRVPLDQSVRLGSVSGTVTLRTAEGTALPTDAPIPPGCTVSTKGPGASAILYYPNGTNVALTEDSTVTLGSTNEELRLDRGVVAADVRPPLVGASPMTMQTAETTLTGNDGFIMTLYQASSVTEVGVQRGSVSVSASTGRSLGEVSGGELLTVRADGESHKQPIRDTASSYSLNLTRPLAPGWEVGQLRTDGSRPVVLPEFWHDPFHGRKMYQIRSDKQWTRGFFRLESDSAVTVRYRVATAEKGRGQLCFCVRTPDVRSPNTGMLEWNGEYGSHPIEPDGWRTLRVTAQEMRENPFTPKFGPPWFGFLFIFNTYDRDLGLQVAEFRVSPAGGTD